jgi:hypothetical protein
MISALSSMASSLTSGTLTSINSGMNMEKLTGFSVLNQKNIGKLNHLLGAAVGQGVQYAMGEDFTLNLLNTGLLSNDYVNSGLLELRFGHDGSAKMNIGTDGMDVGINTLISSVGGALVWNVNNRIDRYTASNNFDGKVMLRAQYGHGDQKQQGQLWNILNGRDKLMVTADGDYAAETEIVDGRRVVKLSGYQSGMSDAEQMALAVILGHEAYRDGIVTNNNYLETRSATLAHTRMLERMLSGGASLSFNSNMIGDLLAYDMSDGNIDVFNAYVDSHYDSSADYWLVKMDGTIVGTPGDPRIWREIYDDNGNIQKELVPGSRESGSQAASLVALLGEDRVLQRLGLNREDALNVSSIDPELLKDVLGWTDAEVRQAIADNIKLDVNDIQRKKILGETLLKQNGYTWDDNAKTWTGTALNIADVSFRGNAGIIKDGDSYIPFAITSTMYRDANAHYLFTFNNKTKKFELSPNEKYKNNTEAFFYYRDLITGEVQQYQFEGPLNFADNADGTKFGANQAYNHPTLGTIQGATVASGQMDIRLTTSSTYGEALLFSNFTDLKGDYFGSNGMRAGNTNDPRTLYHWTIFGLSDSCLVSFDLKGGLTGKQYFNNNMNYLKNNFNLYRGYSIKNTLVDFNLNATPGGGSRAKGYKE